MRRSSAVVFMTIVAVLALPAATNVATGVLPQAWRPYLWLAWPLAGLLAIPVVMAEVRADRAVAPGPDDLWLERLADSVCRFWTAEAEHRRLSDPFVLPVSFKTIGPPISDHWSNIRGAVDEAGAGQDAPLDLDGSLADIDEVLTRRIPSRRLVVLGEPGSGKTGLLLHFTLTRLAARSPGDPVPILLRLSTWEPRRTSLAEWIGERLAEDYGIAAPTPGGPGRPVVEELLEDGLVIPVLDGLDEMLAERHRDALVVLGRAATTYRLSLLLSSRIDEFLDAVSALGGRVLTGSAIVELQPVEMETAREYLTRATPPARSQRWEQLFLQSCDHPSSFRLATAALTTPLSLSLARAAYADRDADPMYLSNLRGSEQVRNYLFSQFVPSVYPDPPAPLGSGGTAWRRGDAEKWLGFLASHLARRGTHDIAWWEVKFAVSQTVRIPLNGLIFGVAVGTGFWLVSSLVAGLGARPATELGVVVGLVFGVTLALAAGLAGAFGMTLASPPARKTISARRIDRSLAVRLSAGRVPAAAATGLLLGLAFSAGQATGTRVLLGAALFGAAFLLVGLLWEFSTMFDEADVQRAPDPVTSWRDDLASTIPQLFAAGLVFAPVLGALGWFLGDPTGGVATGLIGVVTFAVAIALSKAACQFFIARWWLALTGRLPLRLMGFLEDAHRRDVLRQVGGVYQFRHALLRDHLASPWCPGEAPRRRGVIR